MELGDEQESDDSGEEEGEEEGTESDLVRFIQLLTVIKKVFTPK